MEVDENIVHIACMNGDYNTFIQNYDNNDAYTIYGASYLHYAYYGGNYMIIEHLERKIPKSRLDFWGNTIYHYAALGGNYIPSDCVNNYNETPYLLLCKNHPTHDFAFVRDLSALSYTKTLMMELLDDILTNKTSNNALSQICRRDDIEMFKTIESYINIEYYLAIILKYRAANIIKRVLELNTPINFDIMFYILKEPNIIPLDQEYGGLYTPPYESYGTISKMDLICILCDYKGLVITENTKNLAYMAILMREYKLAKHLLIKYGANQSGEILLAEASKESHIELVNYIIETFNPSIDMVIERFYSSNNYNLLKKYITRDCANLQRLDGNNILIRAINDNKYYLVEFLSAFINEDVYEYVCGLNIDIFYKNLLDNNSNAGKIKKYNVIIEKNIELPIDNYGEDCIIDCDSKIECRDKNCPHGFSISAYISLYYIKSTDKCPICRTNPSKIMIIH